MKNKRCLMALLMLGYLITSCRNQDTAEPNLQSTTIPTEETALELPKTHTPTEKPNTLTSKPLPTATKDFQNFTDNPDVNATITALLEQDLETMLGAILLNSQPCTTEDVLGGPPKCPLGIYQGTMLSFLPILSPGEGTYLNPNEVSSVFDYQEAVLFAVVLVKPPDNVSPVFPVGNYAVILEIGPSGFARTFRMNQQGMIVRVDYTFWAAEQEVNNIQGKIIFINDLNIP